MDWDGLGKGLAMLAIAGGVYYLGADRREEMLGPAPLDMAGHIQRFKTSGRQPVSDSDWKLMANMLFYLMCGFAALAALLGLWLVVTSFN